MRSKTANAALSRETQTNITISSRPNGTMIHEDPTPNADSEHQPTPSSASSTPTTHGLPQNQSRRGKISSRRVPLTHRALRQHNLQEDHLLNNPTSDNNMQHMQQDDVRHREAAADTLGIRLPPHLQARFTQEPNGFMATDQFHTSPENHQQQYQQRDLYPAPGEASYDTGTTGAPSLAIPQYGQEEQNFSPAEGAGQMVNYFYPQEHYQRIGYTVPQSHNCAQGCCSCGTFVRYCETDFAEIGAQFETYTYEEHSEVLLVNGDFFD